MRDQDTPPRVEMGNVGLHRFSSYVENRDLPGLLLQRSHPHATCAIIPIEEGLMEVQQW
ncbi:MAG: hypothetical protein ISS52_00040 [Dehalococcoidia bacterium]|nr:hypothetical protein [Dehalococcoidia bacterium]